MAIRAATAEDAAAIAEVVRGVGRESWGDEAPEMRAAADRRRRARRARTTTASRASPSSTDCAIDLLFTHPRAWGRGAGRALVVAAEAALRDARLRRGVAVDGGAQRERPPRLPGVRLAQDDGGPASASGTARRCASCATASALSDASAPHRRSACVGLSCGGLHRPDRGGVRGRAVRRARAGGRGVRAPRLRRADPRRDLAAAAARAPARRPAGGDRVRRSRSAR